MYDENLGGEVRLDQDLYVRRKAEEAVCGILSKHGHTANLILLVGEAGFGKTSLLWHLYDSLDGPAGWEAWFIKSTLLLPATAGELSRGAGHTLRAGPESIAEAAKALIAQKKRPLVLLDTVDLLLHDEARRDDLLELLLLLLDCSCSVIASCRPQEARLLSSVEQRRVTLLEYEKGELDEAVSKYVSRFYSALIQREDEGHKTSILEAVARGLPLREVCTNPLTLRMLFTIYAPSAIPPDINIFKLYEEYWRFRVEQDYRAGSPISSIKSADLRDVAAAVALAMLAEGTPEVEEQRLHRSLEGMGRSASGIVELIARGVLHRSEIGTIAFFHQTFFEHSAARGLLIYLGIKGLSALKDRLLLRGYDLFVSPVYEQALLLAENEPVAVSKLTDQSLYELLASQSLASVSSGIYVYCHRKQVQESIRTIVKEKLAGGDEATIIRFITLAPNISGERGEALFQELRVIWNRKRWREQEHVLELLERLVPRHTARVRAFISEHKILEYTVTLPPTYAGNRKLLRVLSAFATVDPSWSWNSLIALYKSATYIAESRDLQISILNCLCEDSAIFGRSDIAARFEAETSQLEMDTARDLPGLSDSYGRLWAIEWEASGVPVSEILASISSFESGLKLIARMRGLAYILMSASKYDIDNVFSHFASETRQFHQALWAKSILAHLLRGIDARPDKLRHKESLLEIQHIREKVAGLLTEEYEKPSNIPPPRKSYQTKEVLCRAIRDANLPPNVLLELFSADIFSYPEVWLDNQQFASLLIEGFVANHPGAKTAMQLLAQDPQAYWPKLGRTLSSRLIKMASGGLEQVNMFLDLVLKVEDANALLHALEQASCPTPDVLLQRKHQIASLSKRLRVSRSGLDRRSGTRIWSHLLRLEMISPPPLDQLSALFSAEDDRGVRCQIVETINQTVIKEEYDIPAVLQALEPLARSKEEGIRDTALYAIVKAISGSKADVAPFAMRVLDIALAPQTNAGRLFCLRPVLQRLLPADVELATDIVERMVVEASGAGLGVNGSRRLFGRFKPMVRAILRNAPKHLKQRLLSQVPKLDRILGSLIIDGICHECLTEMGAELDEVLNGNAPGDIKEIILRYRYTHERTYGAEDWSEIYTLMNSRQDFFIESKNFIS